MKTATKLLGIAIFAVMLLPAGAHAESYYHGGYNVNASSQQELISYLYDLIAQLQAQIDAQRGGGYHGGSSYNISVETVGDNYVTDDSASLYGNVRLGRASYARVWFDFGESRSFGERSLVGTARHGDYTFRADIERLDEDETYYYRAVAEGPNGRREYGSTKHFTTDDDRDHDDDEDPDVETDRAEDIEDDRADLTGEVDMNDFDDGLVFFVYGEDEDLVEDIEDDYDEYRDIDEEGDDLQKVEIDSSLDGSRSYTETVRSLDDDTDHYFQICVEYEDEDDDETIVCGGVDDFETDDDNGSSSDEEPDIHTDDAENIEDDEAELHGFVDMNDFDDGRVFFVYGEDEDYVEEIEDEYDEYGDIDEEGDDLQKVLMDSNLDGSASYELNVSGLDDDTDHYFQICVEYDDEDDDETILCGGVEDFETDD